MVELRARSVRLVTLPAGGVHIVPCSTPAPTLRQTVEAALEGDPVRLAGGVLRLADLGAVVLGAVTDPAGVREAAPGLSLSAIHPDLPREIPGAVVCRSPCNKPAVGAVYGGGYRHGLAHVRLQTTQIPEPTKGESEHDETNTYGFGRDCDAGGNGVAGIGGLGNAGPDPDTHTIGRHL